MASGVAGLSTLAGGLVLWCALHSLSADERISGWFLRKTGRDARGYRLRYNLVALGTLLPLVLLRIGLADAPVFQWPGWLLPLRLAGVTGAFYLLVAPCYQYDIPVFLGLRHEDYGKGLQTAGILSRVRHPWYSAVLVLLWLPDLDAAGLVTSAVLSIYLVLGARLEEGRLLRLLGDPYASYQKRVPMFIPKVGKMVL